uniref:DUF281 domain-containing protein n=1 Tax=Caenorhabditis tropicalis TaxID=1561998 RepID=A0A1I7TSX9_9PELO
MNFLLYSLLVLTVAVMASGHGIPKKRYALDDIEARQKDAWNLKTLMPRGFTLFPMIGKSSSVNNLDSSNNCDEKIIQSEKSGSCEITATWDFENDSECFKSTYYKKVEYPTNGVPKCTKTEFGKIFIF